MVQSEMGNLILAALSVYIFGNTSCRPTSADVQLTEAVSPGVQPVLLSRLPAAILMATGLLLRQMEPLHLAMPLN